MTISKRLLAKAVLVLHGCAPATLGFIVDDNEGVFHKHLEAYILHGGAIVSTESLMLYEAYGITLEGPAEWRDITYAQLKTAFRNVTGRTL